MWLNLRRCVRQQRFILEKVQKWWTGNHLRFGLTACCQGWGKKTEKVCFWFYFALMLELRALIRWPTVVLTGPGIWTSFPIKSPVPYYSIPKIIKGWVFLTVYYGYTSWCSQVPEVVGFIKAAIWCRNCISTGSSEVSRVHHFCFKGFLSWYLRHFHLPCVIYCWSHDV